MTVIIPYSLIPPLLSVSPSEDPVENSEGFNLLNSVTAGTVYIHEQ